MNKQHCCPVMEKAIGLADGADPPADGADQLVIFWAKFCEYGLPVRDGGSSYIAINYCPWCGTALPASLRDRWFNELEKLGFDDPASQSIPERYESEAWYRGISIGQRLAELKAAGVTPVAALKAIHTEFGVSLVAAKEAFAVSPAWAGEVTNGAQLHEEVLRVLGEDSNSSSR